MISQHDKAIYAFSVSLQLLMSQAVFWGYFAVYNSYYSNVLPEIDTYAIYSVVALAGLVIEASARRSRDWEWTDKAFFARHRSALHQTVFAASAIILFLIATKDRFMSRFFLFSYMPLLYAMLLATTRTPPAWLIRFLIQRQGPQFSLLVGPMKKASSLYQWLSSRGHIGYEIAGVVSNEIGGLPGDPPFLGVLSDLQNVIRGKKISLVILAEPPADSSILSQIISDCENCGVRLLVVSDLQERFRHKITYTESGGLHIIGLREEPLENPINRILKRLMDISISLPVVLFILPVAAVIVWILHRMQSPGPLFYAQERAGFQNNIFWIIKFRTMHTDNPDAARQASKNDVRVFKAGKWLRKFSVDELPQFINVLKGQMSVVGPRPHLREHNELFSRVFQSYHIRSLVKPGITGLAQVRGFRGEATSDQALLERAKSDIYYLENWSFTADILIVFRTFLQVFFPPKSAY